MAGLLAPPVLVTLGVLVLVSLSSWLAMLGRKLVFPIPRDAPAHGLLLCSRPLQAFFAFFSSDDPAAAPACRITSASCPPPAPPADSSPSPSSSSGPLSEDLFWSDRLPRHVPDAHTHSFAPAGFVPDLPGKCSPSTKASVSPASPPAAAPTDPAADALPPPLPTPDSPPSRPSCPIQHLAIIMDGNRRYGRARYSDPLRGHAEGGRVLSNVSRWCLEQGVAVLTVYAFSTENWRRDPREVAALMQLFLEHAARLREEARARGIRVCVLSTEPARLPRPVHRAMRDLEAATAHCRRLTLNLCVSYGSRGELGLAARAIARAAAAGTLDPEAVDEATLGRYLLTHPCPDPDLLLRTSGECRLSNFLLFQLAYAEMVFLDKRWPEVRARDLDLVLEGFNRRERRFGG